MEPKALLYADYLDVIFDKRNKAYGGYELRRHYDQRVRKAALFLLIGVGALCCISFITTPKTTIVKPFVKPLTPTIYHPVAIPPAAPKVIPPPPQAAPQHLKTQTSILPVVGPDIDKPEITKPETPVIGDAPSGPVTTGSGHDGPGGPPATAGGTGPGGPSTDTASKIPKIFVPQMPQFNGDMSAYISSHLHYPESARAIGTEGKVVVQFVVNEDGSVSDAVIVKGIGGGCDAEALKMIRNMPKWKPGRLANGEAVKVYFSLPIVFQLN